MGWGCRERRDPSLRRVPRVFAQDDSGEGRGIPRLWDATCASRTQTEASRPSARNDTQGPKSGVPMDRDAALSSRRTPKGEQRVPSGGVGTRERRSSLFSGDDTVREEGFTDDEESRGKGSIGIVMNAAIPLCDASRASSLGMTEKDSG